MEAVRRGVITPLLEQLVAFLRKIIHLDSLAQGDTVPRFLEENVRIRHQDFVTPDPDGVHPQDVLEKIAGGVTQSFAILIPRQDTYGCAELDRV